MPSVPRDEFFPAARSRLRPVHTVLEIGPGIQPQTLMKPVIHVCIEPCDQYAERLSREHPSLVVLRCTWKQALDLLPPDSVDTVILMDVIEHLEKDEGRGLLDATVRLARSQLVVQTPLGFMAQGENEAKDAWGLDGIDWQVHRSGWLPEDFPGWEIILCEEFHEHDAYGRRLQVPHGAFFAIFDRGGVYGSPELNETIASLMRENRDMRNTYEQSMSWRVTSPMRWIASRLQGR